MDAKAKSQLQEQLVGLYLRLNGFFVTSFIVHSPVRGRNRSELDGLAIRHRYSVEPEREIGTDPALDLSQDYTDLVLCEVKSRGQPLHFNESLCDADGIAIVLRWAGLFREDEISELATSVCDALRPRSPALSDAPTVRGPRNTRIRGLLFSPERNNQRSGQPWFLSGPQIFRFIWCCLSPAAPRLKCSTTYDLQLWGSQESIVRYFKCQRTTPGDMNALYQQIA
jgi:hypothetical protein